METPITSLEEYGQRLGHLDFQKAAEDITTCEHYLSELKHGLTYLGYVQDTCKNRS
jgi:hypothetical protein